MFSTAEKTVKPATTVQRKAQGPAFFASREAKIPSNAFFQPKLTVSQPGDPYEKEADATADAVMRMNDPAPIETNTKEEEKIDRQEEERKEEDSAAPAAMPSISRIADEDKREEETPVQAKRFAAVQRNEQTPAGEEEEPEKKSQIQAFIQRKNTRIHPSDTIQLSGRGPPVASSRFEDQLQNTGGSGNPMATDTRQFMESRFGADFGGVRIHTDVQAQEMSRDIHAHAFTHGNHIYFNSGKYEPDSSAGKTLLAHELTHTIQQGASTANNPSGAGASPKATVSPRYSFLSVQPKIIQRQAPQLDAAIELARGEQGKVIANKTGPDGNRFGWERLLEYFKTTFGEDKILKQYTGAPNTVVEQSIKKKSMVPGQVPNQPDPNVKEKRDAMPSWCGIFVFWSLNKAGIPMPKWLLGRPMMKPEAAYPGGYQPKPGDIAYRAKNSHYGLVTGMEGNRIKSLNGNTAGADNLGGEIQEQVHDPSQWQGFFNPLALATGPLTESSATEQAQQGSTAPARTLREMRREKFKALRKENGDAEAEKEPEEDQVQAKTALSDWSVGADGSLQKNGHEPGNGYQKTVNRQPEDAGNGDMEEEEEKASGKVQTKTEASARHHHIMTRAEAAARIHRTPAGQSIIQGGWFDDAWDAVSGVVSEAAAFIEEGIDAAKNWLLGKVRDFVIEIPGYRLLSYIIGYDPITWETVDKTPANLLDAVIALVPVFGHMIKPVLDYFKATTPVATWLFDAVGRFVGLIESIGSRFESFWDDLSIDDVADPDAVLRRVANLFTGIVNDIMSFVDEAVSTFLTMVKTIALTNIGEFVQNHFPNAFDLLCVVLNQNPITGETVPRNGGTIMDAGLKVLGERGEQIKQQITKNGIYDQAVGWIDRAIAVVTATVEDITNLFSNIWGEINFESLFTPMETFARISEHFTRPITRVTTFITDAVKAILKILKDALLAWLSRTAKGARGYFLITVILGKDVFTGETVERNAENLIHGFMSLMEGGEEQFQQMKESGAIDRTTQKIMAAIRRLNFTWPYIIGLFTSLWESMDWTDLLNPVAAFGRIINTFTDPVRRLVAFVVEIIKIVVEVLLIVMNFPIDVVNNIFRRIVQVIGQIRRDPIGFLKNLLRAIKQGFIQFFDNILTHLLKGLADWLFGQLGAIGIQMPPDLSFRSILNLVLQILGISLNQIMDKVWRKLAERIGQPKVDKIKRMIDKLEGIWRFVRDVMERGPIAIWEYIQEQLSNLWDTVIDAVKNWIMEKIITAVITKLLSMLDPTGIMAVINSVIAIYRAIQSVIEYIRQLLEIVNSFVNGIAEIASGNIQVAADYLERTAARFIPIMIGFLANQVGLGRIAGKIVEMIERVRDMVSKGIDWLIDKALNVGMPIINGILSLIEGGEQLLERGKKAVGNVVQTVAGWLGIRKSFTTEQGETHSLYVNEAGELMIASNPIRFNNYFANLDVAGDAKKEAAKNGAIPVARAIDTTVKQLKKAEEPQRTQLKQQLELDLGILSGFVAILFSGEKFPTGNSRGDAIEMIWYKPRESYPASITLEDRRRGFVTISLGSVKRVEMADPEMLTQSGKSLGIRNIGAVRRRAEGVMFEIGVRYIPKDGDVLQKNRSYRAILKTEPQRAFRDTLQLLGRDMSANNEDADHVLDLQFSGIDDFMNLWPLNADVNRSSLSFGEQPVKVMVNNQPTIQPLNHSSLVGKYFKIKGFRLF